jgi:hypothetical protein
MRIAALVIYQVVTLSGRNIFQLDGSGLCSKVLGILNFPAPLAELPVHSGHHVTGCGDATVVTTKSFAGRLTVSPLSAPQTPLLWLASAAFAGGPASPFVISFTSPCLRIAVSSRTWCSAACEAKMVHFVAWLPRTERSRDRYQRYSGGLDR